MTPILMKVRPLDWLTHNKADMKHMQPMLDTLTIHRWIAACLALTTSVCLTAAPEEPSSTAPQRSERTLQIPLDWQEWSQSSGPLDTYTLRFSPEIKPFLKEPDFGRHRVVRGAFGCGVRTNEFISFAWDQTANRLYLDLNENRDLTDDAEATCAGEYDGQVQLFPRVKLNFNTPSGRHRYLVDLRLGGTTTAQLSGTYVLRCFWHGRVELGGRPYQIGLVENPDTKTLADQTRYLLFRAWGARTEPIRLNPGTPHTVHWPQRVHLAGQSFSLSSLYTNQGGSPGYVLELAPAHPQMGELRLSGLNLYRLILQQPGGYTAILDTPGSAEKIPAGTYQTGEVWLRQAAAEAYYDGPLPLTVRADRAVSLAVGGPLTNSVAAERSGDDLVLRYRLAGAGSQTLTYRMSTEDRNNPPGWAILSGGKQVASGKFAYG
jgi:hypothetical protein